jgi:hypothetical protein
VTGWDDPLARLHQLLVERQIDYALIGGHAVNALVEPRFTADIDLTIDTSVEKLASFASVLGNEGFYVQREHGMGPSGPDFMRFVSTGAEVIVELQAAKTPFQREVVQRANRSKGLRVATAEDLIVLKLIADRPKDQADLIGLTQLEGLDWLYVEQWSAAWEVTERLRRYRPMV